METQDNIHTSLIGTAEVMAPPAFAVMGFFANEAVADLMGRENLTGLNAAGSLAFVVAGLAVAVTGRLGRN